MRLFRSILSVLLVLLWWPSTNSCLIASVLPDTMEAACECDAEHGERESLPCGTKDCTPCATLGNGVNLAALQPPAVPPVICTELDSLAEWMRKLVELESVALAEMPTVPPPIPPPIWRHDVTKAQPVRGPSFAV